MTSATEDGFPWAWLYFRALDCGMSASAFWESSPRAVMALYQCAKATRRPAQAARTRERRTAAPETTQNGPRLNRLPR